VPSNTKEEDRPVVTAELVRDTSRALKTNDLAIAIYFLAIIGYVLTAIVAVFGDLKTIGYVGGFSFILDRLGTIIDRANKA
jgi:hypothetical protein